MQHPPFIAILTTVVFLGVPAWNGLPSAPAAEVWCRMNAADVPNRIGRGLDDTFAQWALRVPGGFGGLFRESGAMKFYLKDLKRGAAAADTLAQLSGMRGTPVRARYDWLDLYGCYNAAMQIAWRIDGVVLSDIDETKNLIMIGAETMVAHRQLRDRLNAARIPRDMVEIVDVEPPCLVRGHPLVRVQIRDEAGRPAARGATVAVRGVDGGSAMGYDTLLVDAGDERIGTFIVDVMKPYYETVTVDNVIPPTDRCGARTVDVRVTLRKVPNAPAVRQVVVPRPISFADGNLEERLFAFVEGDPGISQAVTWTAADTTVVRVTADGMLTSVCRATFGQTHVTATALADPSKSASVTIAVSAAPANSPRCRV